MQTGKLEGIPPRKEEPILRTVKELIEWLELLGKDRSLIGDMDGNTFPITARVVGLWDENDPCSPVAIFGLEIGDYREILEDNY